MALGLVPARGEWVDRWFEVASAATFPKGAAVNFDAAYRVREYASTDSQLLGIALSASTNSTSIRGLNMVQVSVPTAGATMYSDLTTGIAQSALSIGKKVSLYKEGDYASYVSTVIGHASRFSGTVQVYGPIDATRSRVEVSANLENAAFFSTSSVTFAS